jgi:L-lactate dehydrogenase complex protein LldG
MSSREKILAAVKQNQPASQPLPDVAPLVDTFPATVEKFIELLTFIGGKAHVIESVGVIPEILGELADTSKRVINLVDEIKIPHAETQVGEIDPHTLENVDLAVIKAHFGVAENGSVWITSDLVQQRALPFITQHLAVLINYNDVVGTMHQAYNRIADWEYEWACFIAGPSKTADIEQSLVIGAHGSRSMSIFILKP